MPSLLFDRQKNSLSGQQEDPERESGLPEEFPEAVALGAEAFRRAQPKRAHLG
jgi:hypothetical protein